MALALGVTLAACDPSSDGSGGGLAFLCTNDGQCDDGIYCNGIETCDPESFAASRAGCVPGVVCDRPCVEELMACATAPADRRPADCPPGDDLRDVVCVFDVCSDDIQCDDGLFCNGLETCDHSSPLAGARGCAPGPNPCSGFFGCDEDSALCFSECDLIGDVDGDGHASIACGGDDCDDEDANRYPGNVERCDAANVDEDCDPFTFGTRDIDNDGFVDAACANGANRGDDCDDFAAGVHPTATEVCNGTDDNCDGDIDEGLLVSLFTDVDQDGFGDRLASSILGCGGAPGFAPNNFDCNDANASIFPGQIVCSLQTPSSFQMCNADGTSSAGDCGQQGFCVPQPGGFGICQ